MGVKCGNKCHVTGKVDSTLTAQHISEPNRKHATDNDPYGNALNPMHTLLSPMNERAQQSNKPSLPWPCPCHNPCPQRFPQPHLCHSPHPHCFPSPAHTPVSHSTCPGCTIPTIPIPQCPFPFPLTFILREPLWLLHIIMLTHFHHKCSLDNMYIMYYNIIKHLKSWQCRDLEKKKRHSVHVT